MTALYSRCVMLDLKVRLFEEKRDPSAQSLRMTHGRHYDGDHFRKVAASGGRVSRMLCWGTTGVAFKTTTRMFCGSLPRRIKLKTELSACFRSSHSKPRQSKSTSWRAG